MSVSADAAHLAHVADVESRHPKFGAFLRRATETPEVREAYYAAQRRRDEEDHGRAAAAEPGRDVEPRDAAPDAGLEGPPGGASTSSGLEAVAEPPGCMGRARLGLTPEVCLPPAEADPS